MSILLATKRIKRNQLSLTISESVMILTTLAIVVLLSCAVWGGDLSAETLRSWVGASR